MNRFQRSFANHFPALTSRDYSIFWVGQFLSVIGTWAQNTTLPYLAYQITGSSLDLGLIGFATTLPMLFVTLPAGVIVEHLDKRKTVIFMQSVMMLQAFTLAALTISGHIQIWHITVLAFVLGTASAIEITARQAMLIELAGREALPNAIAMQTTAFNLGRVVGPTLAAALLTLNNGAGKVFLSNGISYIFVIGGLFFVRTRYQVAREATKRQNLRAEFGEGQRYIRQNPLVSQIIIMMAVVGFFGFPLLQQIPAIAKDVLAQVTDTEQIVAARNSALYTFQGIGALVAAFSIAFFTSFKKKGIWLTFGQYTFVLALILLSFMRSDCPGLCFADVDRMGNGYTACYHECFNPGAGAKRPAWTGVQYLSMGHTGRSSIWQFTDRLVGTDLGRSTYPASMRNRPPGRIKWNTFFNPKHT